MQLYEEYSQLAFSTAQPDYDPIFGNRSVNENWTPTE